MGWGEVGQKGWGVLEKRLGVKLGEGLGVSRNSAVVWGKNRSKRLGVSRKGWGVLRAGWEVKLGKKRVGVKLGKRVGVLEKRLGVKLGEGLGGLEKQRGCVWEK